MRLSSRSRKVLKVILGVGLTCVLVSSVGGFLFYRHLNHNLHHVPTPIGPGPRPEKVFASGPDQPLNILVMGSDDRDAPGNHVDNLAGLGKRSDTTILLHLSRDRSRAYAVSIPRDSIVDRPECTATDGSPIAGGTDQMWNDAFNVGGPGCTITQFEHLTHVFVDHFVVVDFAGFQGMVDAIGGVRVCIPDPIVDPAHGISIPAGTRDLRGREALDYVRERYVVGDGSDLGRIKRQQAFIASMVHSVLSAGTLAHPIGLIRFLDAATSSLTTDVDSVGTLARIGYGFRNIGMDHIQFLTVPNDYFPLDSDHPGKVFWLPASQRLWDLIAHDEPLPAALVSGAISPRHAGGNAGRPRHHDPAAVEETGLCA